MVWIKYTRAFVLVLSIGSALLINYILFESIKKTSELMFLGVSATAEVVDLEHFRLKFFVQDQVYFFEGRKALNADLTLGSKVSIVYNSNKPESAATEAQFKMLKSFLVLLILLFFILLFAIYSMIRKIYFNLSSENPL